MADPSFCRDCLALQSGAERRCEACGSPRLVRHAELFDLTIAHLDCDAFYAAVEKRDRPDLAGVPLIIGGGQRGVVLTACYNARIKGVRSAMPMFQALKLCPEATIIRPDMGNYAEVGKRVRERMRAITPLVEPVSVDEAFLDLSGTQALHKGPAALTLARLAKEIEAEERISVSIGLSHNKFLAKIASDLQKPRGFSVVGRGETLDFLAARPISAIWGVGEATRQRLERGGIRTIAQLQTMGEKELAERHGAMGLKLFRLSRGIDSRRVATRGEAKSISAETTFERDIASAAELLPILRALCEKVGDRLKATDLSARTVVLKLKDQNFRIRTRNHKMADPTRLADRLFATARALLEKELDGTRFRLLGIGCSEFEPMSAADPADLLDPGAGRRAKAEAALDALRHKFGANAIETGFTFQPIAERRAEAERRAARPREIRPQRPQR